MPKTEKPPKITVSPRADESTWSADDILAKRLQGAPFGIQTDEIPMRDPGMWQLYIGSSQGNESRHYDLVHRKGWIPFTVGDLPDGITAEAIGFRVAEDGNTLVRGVRGEEVVYKMPKETYQRIQMSKAAANTKALTSERAARDEVANAAATSHGSQAADYIAKHAQISIKDTVTGA